MTCSAPRGSLEVAVTTNGENPDPDGYLVFLDQGAGLPVASNGTVTFADVVVGAHEVRLSGLSPNCAVVGDQPKPVTVEADGTRLDLEVRCGPPSGTIRITTTTAGPRPDADGYSVVVNGAEHPVGPNESVTVAGLPVGEVVVVLTGVAANCTVAGDASRSIPLASGATVAISFDVTCLPSSAGLVLFLSDRSGVFRLYRVREDGSGLRSLTPSMQAFSGDWSPDGSKIVFGAPAGVFVMNADGSAPAALGVNGGLPRWSPDGRMILYNAGGAITAMRADGTGATTLAEGGNATWSPDGTRIAFDRVDRSRCVADLFCPSALYTMAADGSDVTPLATAANASDQLKAPAWSPDGTRIAYTRSCCFLGPNVNGVYVMDAQGGPGQRVYQGTVRGGPVWSPDGRALAVAIALPNGTTELTILPSGGGPGVALASSRGYEYPSAWR